MQHVKDIRQINSGCGAGAGGRRLADVGTDHGYVPIWLLTQGRISSAIAMDVNKGPLLRARENRDKYGLQEVMELRLSDGLEKLRPERPMRCSLPGWAAL